MIWPRLSDETSEDGSVFDLSDDACKISCGWIPVCHHRLIVPSDVVGIGLAVTGKQSIEPLQEYLRGSYTDHVGEGAFERLLKCCFGHGDEFLIDMFHFDPLCASFGPQRIFTLSFCRSLSVSSTAGTSEGRRGGAMFSAVIEVYVPGGSTRKRYP